MTTTNDLLSPETISKIERLRGRDPDIDGLLRHAAALQAQLDAIARERREGLCLDKVAEVAVESFRHRAVAAVDAELRFFDSTKGSLSREKVRNSLITVRKLLQQLPTSTEDGE